MSDASPTAVSAGDRKPRPLRWPGIVLLLTVGFFVVPPSLPHAPGGTWFATESGISRAAAAGFVEAWISPESQPASLTEVVEYWAGFHVTKALLAAFLLGAGVGALQHARSRSARTLHGTVVGFSVVALMANVQGASAPLASLASMLPSREAGGKNTQVLASMHAALTSPAPAWPRPLRALVEDFATYHWILAGVGAAVVTGLLYTAVRAIRQRQHFALLLHTGCVVALLLIVAANVTTALDPVPALTAFLGGWS